MLTCKKCKSKEINSRDMKEYTGGGFADYWIEQKCKKCGYLWESSKETKYV